MMSTNDTTRSDSSSSSGSSSSSSDDEMVERKDDLTIAMEEIYTALSQVVDGGRRLVELFEYLPDRSMYGDYYIVIKKPIALTQILEKMSNGSYPDFASFIADFQTMFDNACTYNREDCLAYKDATRLSKEFRKLLLQKMTQYPSLIPNDGPLRQVYDALINKDSKRKPSDPAAATTTGSTNAAAASSSTKTTPPKPGIPKATKTFNCEHCSYSSIRRADVTRHTKKRHPTENIPSGSAGSASALASSSATSGVAAAAATAGDGGGRAVSNEPQQKRPTSNRRGWTPSPYPGAAEQVLGDLDQRRPLHYREITEVAIERKYIEPQGKTPANTMHGQLNKSPLFYSAGKGYFGLATWRDEAGNVPLFSGVGPPVVAKKRMRTPKAPIAAKRVKQEQSGMTTSEYFPPSVDQSGHGDVDVFTRAPNTASYQSGDMRGSSSSEEDSEGEYGTNKFMSRPPVSKKQAQQTGVTTVVAPKVTQKGEPETTNTPTFVETGGTNGTNSQIPDVEAMKIEAMEVDAPAAAAVDPKKEPIVEVQEEEEEEEDEEGDEDEDEEEEDEDDDEDDDESEEDSDNDDEAVKKERMLPLSTLHRTLNYGVAFASFGRQPTSMPWLRSLVSGSKTS